MFQDHLDKQGAKIKALTDKMEAAEAESDPRKAEALIKGCEEVKFATYSGVMPHGMEPLTQQKEAIKQANEKLKTL